MTRQDMTEQLQVACGAEVPFELLMTAEDSSLSQHLRFPQPFALLGRDARSSIFLDHPQISRRHAYFQVVAGRVFCVDLGSRTGLRWGSEVRLAGWLDADQPLTVGPFTFRLPSTAPSRALTPSQADTAWSPLTPHGRTPPGSFGWKLEWEQPEVGSWALDRVLTLIGSSARCKLRLRDRGASRFHCSLVCTSSGPWVVDLLSTQGTRVNGAKVSWAPLRDGDILTVGDMSFRLREEAAAAAPLTSPSGPTSLVPAAMPGNHGPVPDLVPVRDALLTPMIAQFNALQQQMFEQFHQAMMTMFQMFGTLQRDQAALVREELNRVQQISQELQALQTELLHQGPNPEGQETLRAAQPEPAKGGPAPAPFAESPVSRTGDSTEPAPPSRTEPGAEPAPLPQQAPEDIHVRLQQRMKALEQERKSSWQKLLQVMLGK